MARKKKEDTVDAGEDTVKADAPETLEGGEDTPKGGEDSVQEDAKPEEKPKAKKPKKASEGAVKKAEFEKKLSVEFGANIWPTSEENIVTLEKAGHRVSINLENAKTLDEAISAFRRHGM